jgi:hypothetical protein
MNNIILLGQLLWTYRGDCCNDMNCLAYNPKQTRDQRFNYLKSKGTFLSFPMRTSTKTQRPNSYSNSQTQVSA